MKTIWKFPVSMTDSIGIEMPVGARVLTVQVQHGQPYIWVEVDPEAQKEHRSFRLFGTGHPIEEGFVLDYVGTFQMHDGGLVFHLYEELP